LRIGSPTGSQLIPWHHEHHRLTGIAPRG